MAKQLNVNMMFNADISQAQANLKLLQTQLTALGNTPVNMTGMSAGFKQASLAAKELGAQLNAAINPATGNINLTKLQANLAAAGTSAGVLGQQLLGAGTQGEQAFLRLQNAVVSANLKLTSTKGLLSQFTSTFFNSARWMAASMVLNNFVSGIRDAVDYAQDLNESLNNIRIRTGASADEMAKFAEQANKAAKALSTTTTDYTNAALIYYQQGLNDEQVKERTDVTVKMANVTRDTAETVSEQMTAVWNNFDDGSKSLEYYADVMNALGAATASSTTEIATGLEKFAAVADTVGLSYEYATAALATVTATTRQSADVVGTAFKTLFARMESLKLGETLDDGTTLGSYAENLQKVGVSIYDTSGQLKDMDNILEETAAAWEGLDRAQQTALAQGVAGIRQYTQFIALMDNWDFMQENLVTASTAEGTLQEQADIYAESWEAAQDRVTASAEAIYDALIDDEFFIKVDNALATVLEIVKQLIDGFGGVQGVIGLIATIILNRFQGAIGNAIQNTIDKVVVLRNSFRTLKDSTNGAAEGANKVNENVEQATSKFQKFMTIGHNLKNVFTPGKVAAQELNNSLTLSADQLQKMSVGYNLQYTQMQEILKIRNQLLNANHKLSAAEQKYLEGLLQEAVRSTEGLAEKGNQVALLEQQIAFQDQINLRTSQNMLTRRQTLEIEGNTAERLGEIDELNQRITEKTGLTITRIEDASYQLNIAQDRVKDIMQTANQLQTSIGSLTSLQQVLNSDVNKYANYEELINKDITDNIFLTKEQSQIFETLIAHSKEEKVSADDIKNSRQALLEILMDTVTFLDIIHADGTKSYQQQQRLTIGQKEINDLLAGTKSHIKSINDYMTLNANGYGKMFSSMFAGFSNVAMGLQMVVNAIDTIQDESASLTSKIVAITMAFTMGFSAVKSIGEGFKTVTGTISAYQMAKAEEIALESVSTTVTEAKTAALLEEAAAQEAVNAAQAESALTLSAEGTKEIATIEAENAALDEHTAAVESGNVAQTKSANVNKANTISEEENTAATDRNTASKLRNKLMTFAIVAAIAALAAITVIAIKAWEKYKNRFNEALADKKEKLNAINESLEDTATKLDDLNEALETIKNQDDVFADLTTNTQEWTTALIEANNEILTLLDTYPELAQYITTGKYGQLTLTTEGIEEQQALTIEEQNKQLARKMASTIDTSQAEDLTTIITKLQDYGADITSYVTDVGRMDDNGSFYTAETDQEAITAIQEILETISNNPELQGSLVSANSRDEAITALNDLFAASGYKMNTNTGMNGDSGQAYMYAELQSQIWTSGNGNLLDALVNLAQEIQNSEVLLDAQTGAILQSMASSSETYQNASSVIKDAVNLEIQKQYDLSDSEKLNLLKENDYVTTNGLGYELNESAKKYYAEQMGYLYENGQFYETDDNGDKGDRITKEELVGDEAIKSLIVQDLITEGLDIDTITADQIEAYDEIKTANNNDTTTADILYQAKSGQVRESDILGYASAYGSSDSKIQFNTQGISADILSQIEEGFAGVEGFTFDKSTGTLEYTFSNFETKAENIATDKGFSDEFTDQLTGIIDQVANGDSYKQAQLLTLISEANDVDLSNFLEKVEELGDSFVTTESQYNEFVNALTNTSELVSSASGIENATNELEKYNMAVSAFTLGNTTNDQVDAVASQLELAVAAGEVAENFDLEAEELEYTAKSMKKLTQYSDIEAEELVEIAKDQKRYDRAVENTRDNLEDWKEAIQAATQAGNLNAEVALELAEAYGDLLDISAEDLSPSFVESEQNLADLELAINGDTDAYNRLQEAARQDIAIQCGIDDTAFQTEFTELYNSIEEFNDTFPELEVGADLNNTEFLNGLSEMITAAGMTAEQATSYLSSMGVDAEIEEVTTTKTEQVATNVTPKLYDRGQNGVAATQVTYHTQPVYATRTVSGTALQVTSAHKSSGGDVKFSNSSAAATPASGGGDTTPEKMDYTKKSDVVDRYKEITDDINDLTEELEKANEETDRLWGQARIDAIANENQLLEENIDLLKQKGEEIDSYLVEDKQSLINAGAALGVDFVFDENGNIDNYTEQMTKVYEQLHAAEEYYNSLGTKDEQETYKENVLDPLQDQVDALKDAISQYDETLQEQADNIADQEELQREIQDNNYEMISYAAEYKLELNEQDRKILDQYLERLGDDFYNTAEKAAAYQEKMSSLLQDLEYLKQEQEALDAAYAAGEISMADYVEGTQEIEDQLEEVNSELGECSESMENLFIDTLDKAIEKFDDYLSKFDTLSSILDHYKKVLELTGQSKNYKFIDSILRGSATNAENKLSSAQSLAPVLKKQMEEAKAAMEGLDPSSEAYKQAQENYQAAADAYYENQEEILSSAETAAEAWQAIWENAIAAANDAFEDSVTGGLGFDYISEAYSRLSSIQDEYLTKTNQQYETQKMIRNLENEILKTTNTAAKAKLKNYQDEIEALQKKDKLTQLDLEIAQAKYDIVLAEIALEEAQNAKSVVRLQRDNEGNYGYVYTADQDNIAQAQQELEDAQNNLYNIGLENTNTYAQQRYTLLQEWQEAITDLETAWANGEITSEEEYQQKKNEINDYYSQLYEVATQNYNTAVGILDDVALQGREEAYGITYTDHLPKTVEDAKNTISNLILEMSAATDEEKQHLDDLNSSLEITDEDIQNIVDNSNELVDLITGEGGLTDEISGELDDALNATNEYLQKMKQYIDNIIDRNIEWSKSNQDVIKSLDEEGEVIDKLIRKSIDKGIEIGADIGYAGNGDDVTFNNNSWGTGSKLATVNKKDYIVNTSDTTIPSIGLLDNIISMIDLNAGHYSYLDNMNSIAGGINNTNNNAQDITIYADFPDVGSCEEIKLAFDSLINQASQYANQYNS